MVRAILEADSLNGARPAAWWRAALAAVGLLAAAAPGCQILLGPDGELKRGCDPEEGARLCELNTAYHCSDQGVWVSESCGSKTPVCSEGVCRAVVQVAAGGSTTCARLEDGGVWCWGRNAHGQCGVTPSAGQDVTRPAQVPLAFKAVDIAVAGEGDDVGGHACAVLVSGEVWCWGHNRFGQSGALEESGSEVVRPGPVPFAPGAGPGAAPLGRIHAGPGRTCVILRGGLGVAPELWCWGRIDPTPADKGGPEVVDAPSRIELPPDVTGVALGARHTCAIAGGKVVCWGAGDAVNCGEPVDWREIDIPGAADIAAGEEHTCAATESSVVCWGRNTAGQVTGSSAAGSACHTEPFLVAGTGATGQAPLVGIFAGARHACLLRSSGPVKCWGENDSLQVAPKALPAASILEPIALALGSDHSCLLPRTGNVRCWGNNRFGQLGQPPGGEALCGKGKLAIYGCSELPVDVKWTDSSPGE